MGQKAQGPNWGQILTEPRSYPNEKRSLNPSELKIRRGLSSPMLAVKAWRIISSLSFLIAGIRLFQDVNLSIYGIFSYVEEKPSNCQKISDMNRIIHTGIRKTPQRYLKNKNVVPLKHK
jgi:hypothetical protein